MAEDLNKQMQEIATKLKERDEATAKEAEKAWRTAMERDTAGTTLGMFQRIEARFAMLQAQLEATNPLVSVLRGIDALAAKLGEIEARLVAIEKPKEE